MEWFELLAAHRYQEALELLPHSTEERDWDATSLAAAIAGYGVPDLDQLTLGWMQDDHGVERFEIASLKDVPDRAEIVAGIRVNRRALFGLDPARYLGMVHYQDVLLKGTRSDLTAQFQIKRVGNDSLTLEFLNIHVM